MIDILIYASVFVRTLLVCLQNFFESPAASDKEPQAIIIRWEDISFLISFNSVIHQFRQKLSLFLNEAVSWLRRCHTRTPTLLSWRIFDRNSALRLWKWIVLNSYSWVGYTPPWKPGNGGLRTLITIWESALKQIILLMKIFTVKLMLKLGHTPANEEYISMTPLGLIELFHKFVFDYEGEGHKRKTTTWTCGNDAI